ncbi:LacI family DNA-binding transcriptional regulator [Flavihumibacter stibioxidans]|uniref:LacI family transcriptional regulator n=1 Tax=Flavihumibacter stibioxidans TaxID=1834163 RepID=A0ABR7MA86_9BACT|nr:LacI family DNA-binding transcriptional regulator [Flavihumibacter stibioxidans]MBC6491945.1 LacI family transcriptional regulator [Flavihumibacter stibioxidans]
MISKKLPTIKEIAKQLGISVSTVSRALHDHPSIGLRTKTRVRQLAEELGYEPNQTAIFFKQRKTFTIGVILPYLIEDFFAGAISGIEKVANDHKYNVLIGQSNDDVEREKAIITAMKNQRVDGIIVSLSKHTKNLDHFRALEKYQIPIVFFDRVPASNDFNKVAFDMPHGTHQAITYLMGKGHRRIGIINGPKEMKSSKERTDTYMEVMQKKRLKIDLSLVAYCDLTKEGTAEAMETLITLKQPPTAILAINDYVALDAIQYCKSKKLKNNKDIFFVSYANLPITNYLESPPMASIEQFPEKQGTAAAEILMDLINSDKENQPAPRNILIQGELVEHKR